MAELRRAKREAALAIAMADIAGWWDVGKSHGGLTRFADAAVQGRVALSAAPGGSAARMPERDGAVLEAESGLTVLAMGKYGAHELNYSSDIDLVVFYDAARFPSPSAAIRAARRWISCAAWSSCSSETTVDGYVFRVDLRLRPDAGATQVAISTGAAEDYYESHGTELGTRRHDQGAAPAPAIRRPASAVSGSDRALRLAAQSGFRGDRGHPFHQAADPCPWRPWRDRGCGPQHQAGARRHPRDRILRPDAAADPGRAQSGAACARDPRCAARRWRAAGIVEPQAAEALSAILSRAPASWSIGCR